MQPVLIDGRPVHTVGMPIHWGYSGEVVGATVNDLTPIIMESNTGIHEGKSFVCQLRIGRRKDARQPMPIATRPVPTTGVPIPDTPTAAQPAGRLTRGQ
jgi:formate dehydrogenase major subunit